MYVRAKASAAAKQRRAVYTLTAVALTLSLLSCGDGGDQAPATSESATPGASAVASSPAGTQDSCPADAGPPAEGSGGEGLSGRIVFVRLVLGCSPEVYIMNGDGSGATNLSNNPFLDDEPDLSPDGSKVVFLSQREGGSYLYTVNSDGSDLTRLTDDPGGDGSPRWSPDGSRIAFSRGGALAVMDADGSRLKTIMEAQSSEVAEPCRGSAVVGGWSPDGARITYYTAILATRERLGTWYICAINVDGSDVEVLVSEPAGSVQAEPTWSPDGRQIAFRSDRDSKNCQPPDYSDCTFEIYVKDLESGQETNVTRHSAIDIEPNWSPDGEWIIFVSNRDDTNFDLYATRLDGSDVRRLLADPGAKDSYPGWVR